MSDLLSGVMRTIGSGLAAQRKRMEAIASNIANSETTRAEDGLPYRRQTVRITQTESGSEETAATPAVPHLSLRTTSPLHMHANRQMRKTGAEASGALMKSEVVEASPDEVKYIYDPHHPDADENGFVAYPDISPVEEMVDMMAATRAYEANLAAMDAFKSMVEKALEI
jgi:flagellar basal-body rod protein FlgC